MSSLKKNWILTQEAFDILLASLDSDRERAAEKYESIRRKLITFFECRHCYSPEDYADMVINRVARGLSEGKEIHTNDPASYFFGVARNILHEYWSEMGRSSTTLDNLPTESHVLHNPYEAKEREEDKLRVEREIECLEQCIENLTPENRELIIRYYEGETNIKIKNRKTLAEQLKIPTNALRLRALRIRMKLEDCMKGCLQRLPGN
jgi:RNA polymerase sigma factor (sigma-70 family)